jgi:hypothetical protein
MTRPRIFALLFTLTLTVLLSVVLDTSWVKAAIAAGASTAVLLFGLLIIRGLAQPVPEPPPAGELRKVKLLYRCDVCGAEVRMTAAASQDPEPPRHCMDEMTLTSSTE